MIWTELLGGSVAVLGAAFCLAGSVGLIRFPDVYTRLHALTKADNVGLFLILVGMTLASGNGALALRFLLAWVFLLVGSATASHAVARYAYRDGVQPWRRR